MNHSAGLLGPVGIVLFLGLLLWLARSLFFRSPGTRDKGPVSPSLPPLRRMEEYRRLDPDFDPEALLQTLSNLYIQYQQALERRDLSALAPYLTPALLEKLEARVREDLDRGLTRRADRPVVLGSRLEGFCQQDGKDLIYGVLNTRSVAYTLDRTGALAAGSRDREVFRTLRLRLERPSGRRTRVSAGTRAQNCPNCGAPLDLHREARCSFCGAVISQGPEIFRVAALEELDGPTR